VLALRYVYVLSLSLWFGGSIIIGLVAPPVDARVLHRFFVISYVASALVLLSLLAMGLLGPRPSGFAARFAVAAVMSAGTIVAGQARHAPSPTMLCVIILSGLALLFWEARDGTRAA
jgi:hypothetical protein